MDYFIYLKKEENKNLTHSLKFYKNHKIYEELKFMNYKEALETIRIKAKYLQLKLFYKKTSVIAFNPKER